MGDADGDGAGQTPYGSSSAGQGGTARDRGRSSAASQIIVGPAGAKHSFSLLPPSSGVSYPEDKARKAEAEADDARIRERILRRLAQSGTIGGGAR